MAFTYEIAAHPTWYEGVRYRSRLEARWAAFFHWAGWQWQYEPVDLKGWSPDFRVVIPCTHSECGGSHVLMAEVKPFYKLEQFRDHPIGDLADWAGGMTGYDFYNAHGSPAMFGADPSVSKFFLFCGHGGAEYSVCDIVPDAMDIWASCGSLVQWRPQL